MKRFLRFAALLSALALLGACDDDMYVTPLEVTNNNIAGTWQLAEWNGAPLAEGSFVYIESSARTPSTSCTRTSTASAPAS